MVDLVIGTSASNVILHRVSEIANSVRNMRTGKPDPRVLKYEDLVSEVCEDSLWLQDFIMAIEDEYDITIGMRETVELHTVSDLVELIESKTN